MIQLEPLHDRVVIKRTEELAEGYGIVEVYVSEDSEIAHKSNRG